LVLRQRQDLLRNAVGSDDRQRMRMECDHRGRSKFPIVATQPRGRSVCFRGSCRTSIARDDTNPCRVRDTPSDHSGRATRPPPRLPNGSWFQPRGASTCRSPDRRSLRRTRRGSTGPSNGTASAATQSWAAVARYDFAFRRSDGRSSISICLREPWLMILRSIGSQPGCSMRRACSPAGT
jgi:hypothetical protein